MTNTLGGRARLGQEASDTHLPLAVHLLVIDHYDSFTFNVVQRLDALGARCRVASCDRIDVPAIREARPDGLVLSPGPCTPDQAGISLEAVRVLAGELPILGVCLGHQVLAQAFGGRIARANRPVHGKLSEIHHDGNGIFRGISRPLLATRYNSLVVTRDPLPEMLVASAWTAEGELMGLRHRSLPLDGVQFHPESVLSEEGDALFQNWLEQAQRTSMVRKDTMSSSSL